MRLPRNKYKYVEDLVEIDIEMKDGSWYVLISEGNGGLYGVDMNIVYLYGQNERIGGKGLKTRCFSFAMPVGDIAAEVDGGMLVFRRNDEIIFIERRDNIKNIVVGSGDNWINLCEDQREYFIKEFGL